MSSKLFTKASSFIRQLLHLPPSLVQVHLSGRQLTVREGAIRKKADYDDAWFLACANRAQTIFDIGANVGYNALLALTTGRVEHIVLVEANPEALSRAAENLIRNRLSTGTHFIPAFAGDKDAAEVAFWTIGTGAAGSQYRSHARSASRRGQVTLVPTVTIDTLCSRLGLMPDLIKVDVEGAERSVLNGSRNCVALAKTRLLVEMHSNPDMPMAENAAGVLNWCKETGYRAWYLAEAVPFERVEQIAHRGRCHLLLQPSYWPYPEWLVGIKQSAELATVKSTPPHTALQGS